MEEDGPGSLDGRSGQDGVIAVGMETANDLGSGRFVDAQTLAAEGDAAVGVDPHDRALAPDVRPPRAAWRWAQDRTVFPPRPLPGSLRSGADLTMLFVRIVMQAHRLEERVGWGEGGDLLGGKKGGETFLPEVMETFNFAFGLWGGRVAQGDLIEMEGGAELGEGIGLMSEEEGVIIDVECERQATSEKGAGEEVEMSQKRLAWVEPRQRHHAAVIIKELE